MAEENEKLMPCGFPPAISRPISYDGRTINLTQHTQSIDPPRFRVVHDDPVKVALECATANGGIRVPFICAANHRGSGLRHRDNRPTYEEHFCYRSNLCDTLTRTESGMDSRYPISETGGLFSNRVAVYLGPRWDNYEKLKPIPNLPVVSVPPVRDPVVIRDGSSYAHADDKSTMRQKICGALRVCLDHKYDRVVIGDFGLGDGFHNPPRELAEIWRDVLLFDPDLRGQFKYVVFAFVDPAQNITQLHRDRVTKRVQATNEKRRLRASARDGTSSSRREGAPSGPSSKPRSKRAPTDMAIFESVFHPDEIKRVRKEAASSSSKNMVLS